MHISAGNLSQLLESDLLPYGRCDYKSVGGLPIEHVRAESLRSSLTKKYVASDELTGFPERNRRALDLFIKNNDDCKSMVVRPEGLDEELVINHVKVILDKFFHPNGSDVLLSSGSIARHFDVGRGANIFSTNVDLYSKVFCSRMSSSSDRLLVLYRQAISANPTWAAAEQRRETRMGSRVVLGSNLSFVPKTRDISRTTCTEPICNMLWQKGIAAIMEERLSEVFGINLRKQPDKNRELARVGSVTGRFGTIDLSSASDRNSLTVAQEVVPASSFHWLTLSRSPVVSLPGNVQAELHMLSSMGNAFTFPYQTALFAAIVVACYEVLGITVRYPRRSYLGNFGVFGDDIICVEEAYGLVTRMLHVFGHTVNHDKSFNTGPFRESCGSDFYEGHDVRGVYIKRISDAADVYSAVNRLNSWSSRSGIALGRTVGGVVSLVKRPILVPLHESDDAGIRVPFSFARHKMTTKSRKHAAPCFRYQYLRVVTYLVRLDSEESLQAEIVESSKRRPDVKTGYLAKAWYNSDGHLLSAVAGKLRDGTFAIRTFRRKCQLRYRVSPCWDHQVPGPGFINLTDGRIPTAVAINLGELDS